MTSGGVVFGAEGRIRTGDISLTMRTLYQLSYFGSPATITGKRLPIKLHPLPEHESGECPEDRSE
ncbi:MAG: hypothetical protein QG636_196 [Patescibacteria group bacterium]|nr:hypothetical protein [Patescibacteria group bacterium]